MRWNFLESYKVANNKLLIECLSLPLMLGLN